MLTHFRQFSAVLYELNKIEWFRRHTTQYTKFKITSAKNLKRNTLRFGMEIVKPLYINNNFLPFFMFSNINTCKMKSGCSRFNHYMLLHASYHIFVSRGITDAAKILTEDGCLDRVIKTSRTSTTTKTAKQSFWWSYITHYDILQYINFSDSCNPL